MSVKSPFISMLFQPRMAVRYLNQSMLVHFRLIAALTVIYFLQLVLFALSLEDLSLSMYMSINGLIAVLLIFLLIGIGVVVFVYALTLAVWIVAKRLNGQGTLPQTRGAILSTLVGTIPLGFFLLLIQYTVHQPDTGHMAFYLRVVSYFGILATLIYDFYILLITLSETQDFDLAHSFISSMIGLALFVGAIILYFKLPV